MAQITKGDTFADGQQLTAARLNQLIDSATVLPNIITDQTNLTANTVASGDSILLYDLSATALREATASDLLNSNIPVTTSSVTAGANSDITLTTSDGTIVNTGVTYASANGLNVTVTTPTAHGLVVGQVITVSSAGTGYNGTFRITAVTTTSPFTFSYVMTVAATATTGTPSCAYTRQGAVRNNDHEVIAGNLYVDGTTFINTLTSPTGTLPISGSATIGGNVSIGGATTQTGNLNCSADLNVKTFKVLPRYDYIVQNRDPAIYGVSWGGNQNPTNLWGIEIPSMTITFTPKQAGNIIILTWNISGELASTTNGDGVWLVTRTVNGVEDAVKSYTITPPVAPATVGTVTATANLSVDASNNTWSGTAPVPYDNDQSTTPNVSVIKIVDGYSSNLPTTYKLRLRMSSNATTTNFNFNRSGFAAFALGNEQCMSVGHAQEICLV